MKQKPLFLILLILLVIGLFTFHNQNFMAHATTTRTQGNIRGSASTGSTVQATFTNTPTNGHTIIVTIDLISTRTVIGVTETGVVFDNTPLISSNVSGWQICISRGIVGSGSIGKTITITLSGNLADAEGIVFNACEYSDWLTIDKTATASGSMAGSGNTGTTANVSFQPQVWIGLISGSSDSQPTQSAPTNGFTLLDGVYYTRQGGSYYMSGDLLEYFASATNKAWTNVTFSAGSNFRGCIVTLGVMISVGTMGVDSTLNFNADTIYANWSVTSGSLSFYVFGCNITASWVNDSTTAFSGSPSVAWVNVTKTPNLNVGDCVQWEQWANNSGNIWGNTGLQNWTVTAIITFCFSNLGTIERNGTSISNSTVTTYSVQTNLSMSALPAANYTLLVWNSSYVSSTDNPYTFVVVRLSTLWCYFWDSGTWNYSQGYTSGYSTGYSAGYSVGWNAGNATGYTNGWNAGNASGYTNGWNAGNATGYTQGWIDGNATGYANGYADGLAHGGSAPFIYARFTMNDTAPYQNQDTVFFNASLSNSSSFPLAYYWEFGDTNISTGQTTTHIYLSSGIYIVNLTVMNGSMSDTMLQNITVFATSINITFDWNDLLFGSGAWLPFIAIMLAMFIGVAWNKWFIVAAFPIMALMSFLYFDHIATTPSLVWEALIMICSAIVLLLYSASKEK